MSDFTEKYWQYLFFFFCGTLTKTFLYYTTLYKIENNILFLFGIKSIFNKSLKKLRVAKEIRFSNNELEKIKFCEKSAKEVRATQGSIEK